MEELGDDFEGVRDDFVGDWRITSVHGYTDAELHEGEPARISFEGDLTAVLVCAGVDVTLDVQFGETLEGLSAATFRGRRPPGQKRVTVSGLAAIRRSGRTLEGSLT